VANFVTWLEKKRRPEICHSLFEGWEGGGAVGSGKKEVELTIFRPHIHVWGCE